MCVSEIPNYTVESKSAIQEWESGLSLLDPTAEG